MHQNTVPIVLSTLAATGMVVCGAIDTEQTVMTEIWGRLLIDINGLEYDNVGKVSRLCSHQDARLQSIENSSRLTYFFLRIVR